MTSHNFAAKDTDITHTSKKCSDAEKLPVGNYMVMLLMATVFAIQFLGDPNQKYLTGLILTNNATFSGFWGYFWLHTGLVHIIGNLVMLGVFGRHTCIKMGDAKYFLAYIVLAYAAAIAHVLLDGRPVIGASGAIFGVMGMAVVLSWRKLSLFGPWLILIWVVISLVVAIAGNSPSAHIAHIAGFIAGMFIATLLVIYGIADHRDTDHRLKRIFVPAVEKN